MLPPKVILTTTDFSDASRPGLVAAAQLARATGATLHVVHAEEPLLAAAARHQHLDVTAQTQGELQAFVAAAIPDQAGHVQLHIRPGRADEVIDRTAAAIGADMIVIASHGRSGVGRAVFGSVAEAVIRGAKIPVLVVPAASAGS
jgi:nucleotide-binding universal stress UspA family protein